MSGWKIQPIDVDDYDLPLLYRRCKSDMLLNNLCESLNKELVPAREKPIIACVDFIREYFMKRIVVVQKVIEKQKGSQTPAATRLIKVVEKDANDCQVIWNGGVKYQVAAPWGEQCVVDIQHMVCSCKKWELSGLPCKHAVAVNWDMRKHKMKVGIAESWAHKCYWLETWEHAYRFKVNPVTDATTWPKSGCTTTLTPPIHHNPGGRPKKKRVRGQYEDEPLVKGGKLARRVTEGKCGHCGNRGHNARTCKGQGGGTFTQVSQTQGGPNYAQTSQVGANSTQNNQGVNNAGGSSNVGGSSQGYGSSRAAGGMTTDGKKLSKVRGKSQRILKQKLSKVIPGPGLHKDDAINLV